MTKFVNKISQFILYSTYFTHFRRWYVVTLQAIAVFVFFSNICQM